MSLGEAPILAEETQATLALIWQRVLRRSPIDVYDSFFDLGGTDSLAARLFSEIAQVFGTQLPRATLNYAPTIAAMAAVLEQPTLPRLTPFLQVKAGSEKPPIFITHGLSGTVQFFKLARHIRTGHPIYGIQAKGINGMGEPFDRVEDMAEFYLDALAEFHPDGPYILIGYSFGGLVALEVAQRLLESGKRVALLVLLDTFPNPRFMPAPWRLRLFVRRMRIHARHLGKLPLPKALSYFANGLKRRLHLARALNDTEGLAETLSLSFEQAALRRVNEKAYVAYRRYRPRFYPGKIKFVTTDNKTFFPGDPAAIWADLAAELEVEAIDGNHLDIVTTKYEGLAAVLTRYLQQVPSGHN